MKLFSLICRKNRRDLHLKYNMSVNWNVQPNKFAIVNKYCQNQIYVPPINVIDNSLHIYNQLM